MSNFNRQISKQVGSLSKVSARPELLAPAGGPSALMSAVINGADAVYIGLKEFSARAKAENFNRDNLVEWVRYAALYGTRVYLAVNTVIKEGEMAAAIELINFAHQAGVSAFIVQDMGLVRAVREAIPNAVLHGSTQMGIHNYQGAKAAMRMGITRVIVARETLLSDIKRIKSELDIELECFVQGALCVCFSGNCYYSSMVTGQSGNRGRCLQFCRKHYTVMGSGKDKMKITDGNLLSAKDLCLLPDLDKYIEAGVDSFKIEGRMRRDEYVGGAVGVYRQAIDNYYTSHASKDPHQSLTVLKRLYNRGEYLAGYPEQNVGEQKNPVIFPDIQGHSGWAAGVVKSVDNRGIATLSRDFAKGDGLKFLRGGQEVGAAVMSREGNATTFKGSLKSGDQVRLTTDTRLNDEISARTRRIAADLYVRAVTGEPISFSITAQGVTHTQVSDWVAETAVNNPMSSEDLSARFCKLNNTPFEPARVTIDTDGKVWAVVSKLNALRNIAAESLQDKLTKHNLLKFQEEGRAALLKAINNAIVGDITSCPANGGYSKSDHIDKTDERLSKTSGLGKMLVAVDNIRLLTVLEGRSNVVIFSPQEYTEEVCQEFCSQAHNKGLEVLLNLPIMARGADYSMLQSLLKNPIIDGIVVNNIYGLELIQESKKVIFGTGLNILNSRGYSGTRIISQEGAQAVVEGDYVCSYLHRPILMTMAHCPNYTTGAAACHNCDQIQPYTYRDDHGLELILRRVRLKHCYRELRACRPYKNIDAAQGNIYVDLCGVESIEEAAEILSQLIKPAKSEVFVPLTVY